MKDINNLSEEEQVELVRTDYEFMTYITNQKVQIECIKMDPQLILWIKDPEESLQIQFVNHYPFFIRYINNPSEKVQIETVKSFDYNINKITLDKLVNQYILSYKAKEIYYKIIKIKNIIK